MKMTDLMIQEGVIVHVINALNIIRQLGNTKLGRIPHAMLVVKWGIGLATLSAHRALKTKGKIILPLWILKPKLKNHL